MLMTDWAELCPRSHQHPQQFTGSSLIFNGVEQPEAPLMLHYIWQLADHFSNSFRDTFSGRTEDSELPFSLRRPGDSAAPGRMRRLNSARLAASPSCSSERRQTL